MKTLLLLFIVFNAITLLSFWQDEFAKLQPEFEKIMKDLKTIMEKIRSLERSV